MREHDGEARLRYRPCRTRVHDPNCRHRAQSLRLFGRSHPCSCHQRFVTARTHALNPHGPKPWEQPASARPLTHASTSNDGPSPPSNSEKRQCGRLNPDDRCARGHDAGTCIHVGTGIASQATRDVLRADSVHWNRDRHPGWVQAPAVAAPDSGPLGLSEGGLRALDRRL
jgi:hypothetical protein